MSEIKALEHSTLIVPYESLNRTFRNAQKIIDREVSHVSSSNDKLKKISSKNSAKVKETEKELDDVLNKLILLKQKAIDTLTQEENKLSVCTSRLSYLKEQAIVKKNIVWKRNRLDRMLVDYLLRCGYYDSAIKLAENSSIREYVDRDLFMIAKNVETALKHKDSSLCLQWCHTNKSKLKKMHSTLELNVRIQEFVTLIKNGCCFDAVQYARKHFSSDSGSVPDIQKTVMGLLAFKPNTQIKRYKELFDDNRWDFLVEQFRKENLALHQLHSQSMLEIVLQCGLASLKTPHCFHEEEKCQDCPVCCRLFNELAKPLPFAHSSQSRLLCSISGDRMNEHNHPLMLPNGNVYGEIALLKMADSYEGYSIKCPRSQQVYAIDEAKKIYVM